MRTPILLSTWVARFWYPAALIAVALGFFAEQLITPISDAVGTMSILAGDPFVYEDRWADIRSGELPYLESEFEHFPLTLVPIVLAGLVSELTGIPYWNTFVGVIMVITFATIYAVRRIGTAMGDEAVTGRFLWLLTPLLPLVLFRTDLLPVMCVAFALMAWMAGRERSGVFAAVGGVLAKGWPVVLTVSEWWRGRRTRAVLVAMFTMSLALTLILLPGFQSGRAFRGIHLETVVGSLILTGRHLLGFPLGTLADAGALYIEAAPWLVATNVVFGASFGLWAMRGLRHPFSWRRAHLVVAALTLGLLLASPIFSPQFLVWPVAFLALIAGRHTTRMFVVISLLSIVYVGFWDDTALWWALLLLVRNVVFVVLVGLVVRDAAAGREQTV